MVAIYGESGQAFPIPPLDRKLALDLNGNIPAVAVVYEIFNRQHNIPLSGIGRKTVIVIGKRDKSHSKGRKYPFQISPGLDVIPPETGQVFHNDAIHPARLNVSHHPFKFWSVEIAAGIIVIRIAVKEFHIHLPFDKRADQLSLTADAVALGFECAIFFLCRSESSDGSHFAVLPGKAKIHGCKERFLFPRFFHAVTPDLYSGDGNKPLLWLLKAL